MSRARSISFIILVIFIGAMLGTLLGDLIAFLLPEGVVEQFFLRKVEFSLGGLLGDIPDAISLNLGVLILILGFKIYLNFTSLVGLGAAYYFLRYFR